MANKEDKLAIKAYGLLGWFRKHIKKPYYYVPPCPNCGSKITGRYIKLNRDTVSDWQVAESLKNGEIVKPLLMESRTGSVPNAAFCLSCEHEWDPEISLQFFSLAEIEEQKDLRHTREMYTEFAEDKKEKASKFSKTTLGRYMGKL